MCSIYTKLRRKTKFEGTEFRIMQSGQPQAPKLELVGT